MSVLKRCGVVSSLLAFAMAPMSAATPEDDTRFDIIKSVIDREVQMTADRLLADYAAADGDETYRKVLRLHYARTFAVVANAADKAKLDAEATSLQQELSGDADGLRPALADIIRDDNPLSWVNRFVQPVTTIMNPHRPRPQVWTEDMQKELQARFDGLVDELVRAVEASDAAIKEWDPTLEAYLQNPSNGNPEDEIEGIKRRFNWVSAVWLANIAMREMHVRSEEWGLDPSKIIAFNKEFFPARFDEIDNWDWLYGDSNIAFKYRLLVLRMQGALWGAANIPLEDMIAYADEGLFLDTAAYRGNEKIFAENTKSRILYDIMYWYLQLSVNATDEGEKQRFVGEALRRFEERKRDVLQAMGGRDAQAAEVAAQTVLLASRLYGADGRTQDSIAMLKEVQNLPASSAASGYGVNAKEWGTRCSEQW